MGEKRVEVEHGGHKPPSRIRYEESHPVVSFRVNKEIHQQLEDLLSKSGRSIGDFFREALAVQQTKTGEAYQRGYKKGYEEARKVYRVSYLCCICSGTLEVTSLKEKEATRRYMEEHRWGHGACHEKSSGGGY